ncbi:acid phosphatase type 7 isoform X2 [Plodia interpunctella]|uniref:acid phosphatase type 7 isoform X2 n=1 Tax=Plodia interpunctella TaxID=58824 RepID=UPI002367A2BF|nr:acid phosphatase type 7 isoform X1 [Plodia interpunctella]
MKFFILILFLGVAWASSKQEINEEVQPEQVHLSFGDATNEIVVTWSTLAEAKSVVLYGIHETNKRATGSSSVFVDGGKERRKQWIHRVKLKNLAHNTKYVYKAGSDAGYSQQFSFRTPPAGENWPMRIAIYGDMGVNNSMALPYLKRDVEAGMYDFILHVGDFAYDMNEQGGRVGDQFMNKIEPLAANLPYMTCPGNHESAYNFTHYSHRFTMPGDRSSLFYSFDVGPVHFVSISTEVYYFTQYGLKLISDQYHWLKKDLEKAAKIENRQKRPWIVVFGHRPMYCSNSDDYDCSVEYTRVGLYGFFGLEPLLKDYGVDIALWAHEHSYERTWPLYDQRMYNGTTHPYTNPGAPVHIVTGSAGCREGRDRFKHDPPKWSAFRSQDYGYTKFFTPNKTHIYIEQVSADLDGQVIDSFWLIKTKLRFNL